MSAKSRAVVFVEPGEVEIWELDMPDPGPEDIVVKMLYSGISVGAEGGVLRGQRPEDTRFPCVSGYQQTGEVVETGRDVKGFKVGDVVNLSGSKLPEDIHYGWGAHMEYSVQNYRNAVKVPKEVDPKVAALAKTLAVGYRGVKQTGISKGDLVAVIGLGLIGQGYSQIARLSGARVVGSDIIPMRRDLAWKHSCDKVIDGCGRPLEEAVLAEKPEGADVAVEASGRTELIDEAVRVVRPEGKVVWQGWYPGRVAFTFHPAHQKQVRMVFPSSIEGEVEVLKLLAEKKLVLDPLITHTFEYFDAPKAWEMLLNHPEESLGVVLKWH